MEQGARVAWRSGCGVGEGPAAAGPARRRGSIGAWFGRAGAGPQVTLLTVERRDFVQSVVASGRDRGATAGSTSAPDHPAPSGAVTGRRGQTVDAGRVLVELDGAGTRGRRCVRAELSVARARRRACGSCARCSCRWPSRGCARAQTNLDNARSPSSSAGATMFATGFIGQAALGGASNGRRARRCPVAQQRRSLVRRWRTGGAAISAWPGLELSQAQVVTLRRRRRGSRYAPHQRARRRHADPSRRQTRGDVVQAGKVS